MDHVAAYLEHLALLGYAKGTVETYRKILTSAQNGGPDRDYLLTWIHTRSVAGRGRYRAIVNAWLRWLNEQSIVKLDPLPKERMPSEPKPLKPAPTKNAIALLLVEADRRGPEAYALCVVAATTGLRAAELCSLNRADAVEDNGRWYLHVRCGKGNKDRIVPLTSKAVGALHRLEFDSGEGWEHEQPLLLNTRGERWTPNGIAKRLQRLSEHGEITPIVAPHDLRRYFATTLWGAKVSPAAIQRLLGHSDLDTTMKYIRLTTVDVAEAHEAAFGK